MGAFCQITFTRAMWGYLISLYDLRHSQVASIINGVNYSPAENSRHMCVGLSGDYGGYQPWGPDNEKLSTDWARDYYVVAAHCVDGVPMVSRDIAVTPFYPERVMVYGEDKDGNDLSRQQILRHLEILKFFSAPFLWTPCRIWRGYNRGLPTFHTALRADTHSGARILPSPALPEHYYWAEDGSSGPSKSVIYDPELF